MPPSPPKPHKMDITTPTSTLSTVTSQSKQIDASGSKSSIQPSTLSEEPPLRVPETIGTLIEVRTSPKGGLGVFALCPIPINTLLLSEQPLVILTDTGTRTDPLDALVSALSPSRKAEFLSLHAYQANPRESRNRSILYSNGFGVGKVESLSTGVFGTASRFNHACVANARYKWEEEDVHGELGGRMKYFSKRDVGMGEEITVDYGHGVKGLKRFYGFECDCGGCRKEEMRKGVDVAGKKDVGTLGEVGLEVVLSEGLEGLAVRDAELE
ncbi:hypothetical protein SBOR_0611 [Sclerotinia borealis F-4128]|uniref:SET domain-containing protein n=1 Tax=Sclerotinia borealis (strain F-4128) TaxID=1432307 RepID=W9CS65_SCLBF|nr:hypothetical protein SBOR_0611 [Sclerotinia borealis F-4128]